MMSEINVAGIYVAPIVIYALIAIPIFLTLRWLLSILGFWRIVWHPALFETALYISIVSLFILL